MEYKKILDDLVRTRLLFNTKEELGRHVGFHLESRNSLSGIGGDNAFLKHAVVAALNDDAEELTEDNISLYRVLNDYEDASKLYADEGGKLKTEADWLHVLLAAYGRRALPSEWSRSKQKAADAVLQRRRCLPYLLLMGLGVLPAFTSRKGDVKDIEADFRRTLRFLRAFTRELSGSEDSAVILRMEQSPVRHCRLRLIYVAALVFDTCNTIEQPSELAELNAELRENNMRHFDVAGCWSEYDDSPHTTTFWRFEKHVGVYFLYRCHVNEAQRTIDFVRYEAAFYELSGRLLFYVVGARQLKNLLEGRPYESSDAAWFVCEIDNAEAPQMLRFSPEMMKDYWLRLPRLVRIRQAEGLERRWAEYAHRAATPDDSYEFCLELYAITAEALYLRNETGGYYRVPTSLDPSLPFVSLSTPVGILHRGEQRYVAFPEHLLYYEITTEAQQEQWGITLTDTID